MSVIILPTRTLTYPHARNTLITWRKEITSLAKAITSDGLLNPLIVSSLPEQTHTAPSTTKYRVVDGSKRLIALKILKRAGRLPRSLVNVPCIDISSPDRSTNCKIDLPADNALRAPAKPLLKTDSEFTQMILSGLSRGQTPERLAARYDCALSMVEKAASTSNLHSQIRDYFYSGHLSLDQAAAFATLPSPQAQWALLQELGPFAHQSDIIAAILDGETVLGIPDGRVLILPSRKAVKPSYALSLGNCDKAA